MTIIVPTDFSQNANHAVHYACQLAQSKNMAVHLLHCYTSASVGDNSTGEENLNTLKADQLIIELQNNLLSTFKSLEISVECSRSLVIDKLTQLSQNGQYALIVMGASGADQLKPLYWGSTTVAVASKSEIPVVVIPTEINQVESNHAALLTNFKSEELDTLKEYLKLVGSNTHLTLIHVFKENQKQLNIEDALNSWAYNIREMSNISQVDTVAEPLNKADDSLDSIPEVVSKIINEVNPSIILITPSRKTFFKRWFTPSVSKAIALELSKPAFFDKI